MKSLKITVKRSPGDAFFLRTEVEMDNSVIARKDSLISRLELRHARIDLFDLYFDQARAELREWIVENLLAELETE